MQKKIEKPSEDVSEEYLSQKAYVNLEDQLAYLSTQGRREISERIEEGASLGDISENAEYQIAKDEQLMNEKRIAELEDLLNRAVVIRKEKGVRVTIELGASVILKKEHYEETIKYQMVGSEEADPSNHKISNESPLGGAILNKKKGDKVEVLTPSGKVRYTVIDIG